MRKLGISVGMGFDTDIAQQTLLAKAAGFDCVFVTWDNHVPAEKCIELTEKCAAAAEKCGIEIETLHTPFGRINSLWGGGSTAQDYINDVNCCIDYAKKYAVKTVVMHETIGSEPPVLTKTGFDNFEKIVNHAVSSGVQLAFENLEFPRFLRVLLDKFKSPYVGFCYDCGHEFCYTPGVDYLPMYGNRLFCVHLHDNFGMNKESVQTFDDDSHMIPFDAGLDFERVTAMLKKSGYGGSVMLELSNKNPLYNGLDCETYMRRANAAAVRLRIMLDGN